VHPLAADLPEEAPLAAAAEQMPHHRDRQHLCIRAGRRRAGASRHRDHTVGEGIVDQDVDVNEEV
jgi:hypothetical protein